MPKSCAKQTPLGKHELDGADSVKLFIGIYLLPKVLIVNWQSDLSRLRNMVSSSLLLLSADVRLLSCLLSTNVTTDHTDNLRKVRGAASLFRSLHTGSVARRDLPIYASKQRTAVLMLDQQHAAGTSSYVPGTGTWEAPKFVEASIKTAVRRIPLMYLESTPVCLLCHHDLAMHSVSAPPCRMGREGREGG